MDASVASLLLSARLGLTHDLLCLCLCLHCELPFPVYTEYTELHTHTHTFILWRLTVAILVTPRQKTNESLSWGLAAEVLELAGNAARDN